MIRPWKVPGWLGHQGSSVWTWTRQNMSKVWTNCCELNCKFTVWHMVPDKTLNLPTFPNFQLRNLAALTLWTPRTTTSQCKRWGSLSECTEWRWQFVQDMISSIWYIPWLIVVPGAHWDDQWRCRSQRGVHWQRQRHDFCPRMCSRCMSSANPWFCSSLTLWF